MGVFLQPIFLIWLIFQLKRPDKVAINILLVKLDWDIYDLSQNAIH